MHKTGLIYSGPLLDISGFLYIYMYIHMHKMYFFCNTSNGKIILLSIIQIFLYWKFVYRAFTINLLLEQGLLERTCDRPTDRPSTNRPTKKKPRKWGVQVETKTVPFSVQRRPAGTAQLFTERGGPDPAGAGPAWPARDVTPRSPRGGHKQQRYPVQRAGQHSTTGQQWKTI